MYTLLPELFCKAGTFWDYIIFFSNNHFLIFGHVPFPFSHETDSRLKKIIPSTSRYIILILSLYIRHLICHFYYFSQIRRFNTVAISLHEHSKLIFIYDVAIWRLSKIQQTINERYKYPIYPCKCAKIIYNFFFTTLEKKNFVTRAASEINNLRLCCT